MLSDLIPTTLQSRPTKTRAVSVSAGLGLSVFLLLGGFVSTGQAGTPTIDGHFGGAGEGYTNGYSVTFTNDVVNAAAGITGEVWFHQNAITGDVSVALVLPLSLKDNTYGANSTFYTNNQNFQDFNGGGNGLTGSDKALFALKTGGGTSINLKMDFLHGFTDSTLSTESKDNGPFFATGFTGKDKSPLPGAQPTGVLAAATSMGYNFGLFGDENTDVTNPPANYPFGAGSSSPEIVDNDDQFDSADYTLTGTGTQFAGWDFNHSYEFLVSSAVFGADFDITDQVQVAARLMLNEIHLSPKKLDGAHMFTGDIGDPLGAPPGGGPPSNVVPEPSSVTLALTGIVGMLAFGWRRRRRNKPSLETVA